MIEQENSKFRNSPPNSFQAVEATILHTHEVVEPDDCVHSVSRSERGTLTFSTSKGKQIFVTKKGYAELKRILPVLDGYAATQLTRSGREGNVYLLEYLQELAASDTRIFPRFFEKRLSSDAAKYHVLRPPVRGSEYLDVYQVTTEVFARHGWQVSEILLATEHSNYFRFIEGKTLQEFLIHCMNEDGVSAKRKVWQLLNDLGEIVLPLQNEVITELCAHSQHNRYSVLKKASNKTILSSSGRSGVLELQFDFVPSHFDLRPGLNLQQLLIFFTELYNWMIPEAAHAKLTKAFCDDTVTHEVLKQSLVCVDPLIVC